MAYFEDLTEYRYSTGSIGAKNVGWLAADQDFPRQIPSHPFVERLWQFCKISVCQTRGIHDCELCGSHSSFVEQDGETLLLGSSEIRVFAESGETYASPTLIYHYVVAHDYDPPTEFKKAVVEGPTPGSEEYFSRLRSLGLEWSSTSSPKERPTRYRAVRRADGTILREEI